MKNTKLTWFDRLMVGVTFAEAGIEVADLHGRSMDRYDQSVCSGERDDLFEPGRDSSIPAHT